MNRTGFEENGDVKGSYIKHEAVSYAYDPSYMSYSTTTTAPTPLNQPLPGQPPLPPMPPPQGAVPPPPASYGSIPTQVAQLHAWQAQAQAQAHAWQWITPQATPLPPPPQTPRDIAAAAAFQQQREMPMRNNYVKRERYNNNRNMVYQQRGNYHRKNRRRFDQNQGQFDQASYFGAALTNSLGLDWQRSNEALMHLSMQNQLPHIAAAVANARRPDEPADQDTKEEIVLKKNKQRKPMSQSYPSRPWIREDADRALKTENEYNKTVKAQSLIIKFPDPDLNKEIVREFHPGIQNIHFQSPSGPRYCFIQMAESVDIDEAIKELEKIPFGTGHLKVERKSLRDEDNPTPEEIDPYTLYIGNLPESVNVNEVKSKFPTAARVDVGYAQKMRNTRYAFIRYNSVDESIAAYKQAHDLMWDTRSIIVRFRRQRGNTCLPGETKSNPKKNKEEAAKVAPSNDQQSKVNEKESSEEKNKNHITDENRDKLQSKLDSKEQPQHSDSTKTAESTGSVSPSKNNQQQKNRWDSEASRISTNCKTIEESEENTQEGNASLITEIKEEPVDYDEMNEISMEDDDDDDDDEGVIFNQDGEEDDDDSDDLDDDLSNLKPSLSDSSQKSSLKDDIPSDNLDKMFSDLNQSIAGDIEL